MRSSRVTKSDRPAGSGSRKEASVSTYPLRSSADHDGGLRPVPPVASFSNSTLGKDVGRPMRPAGGPREIRGSKAHLAAREEEA